MLRFWLYPFGKGLFFDGDFPCKVRIHLLADFLGRHVVAKQKHQFGQCTFRCAVISADDTGFEQLPARFIPFHFHAT